MEQRKSFSRSTSSSGLRPRRESSNSSRSSSSSRPRTGGASSGTSRSYSSSRQKTDATSAPRAFSSRPPLGRTFNASRGGSSRGSGKRGPRKGQHIDISRFINKTVITEEAVVFTPEHLFKDFIIDERLKANILTKGYNEPTPIQDRVIPHILHGHDLVGIANTGTGKTAAFLIPLINKVLANPKEKVIVMAPTRELAQQIEMELKGFVKGFKIFSVCCVGGAAIGRQISDLRYQHNFIIGTPGRIKDLIERKCINLADFKSVVLDEADRMLDMGFAPQIKRILKECPPPQERQTLLFSATMPDDISDIAARHMRTPVRVEVARSGTVADNIEQEIFFVKKDQKLKLLEQILQEHTGSVLIFVRTKYSAKKICKALTMLGHKAAEIHSNRSLYQRKEALSGFKTSKYRVLVATDIASRGIDVTGIQLIVNYDLPENPEDYVHRIGRTGRAGLKGRAISMATKDQKGKIHSIEMLTKTKLKISGKQEPGQDDEPQEPPRHHQGQRRFYQRQKQRQGQGQRRR